MRGENRWDAEERDRERERESGTREQGGIKHKQGNWEIKYNLDKNITIQNK